MDYEKFKEQFTEDVKNQFAKKGIEADISTREIKKLNQSYDSITVMQQGSSIGVNININNYFEAMKNGSEYDEVVKDAVVAITNGINESPNIDVAALTNYEKMKDKLVMEVVSAERNAELLSEVPHKEIEDMAVVYRFLIDSNEDGRATVLVTNQMLETMGITAEQLQADALKNAPQLKPAVITGMNEVMVEMMGQEQAEMMGIPIDGEEQMFVATVPDKVQGASVLAYQGFMDQATERIGGDFFILPSSIHELLIVPDNGRMDLSQLQDMVREVNATQVSPEEKLTDNVYHYDSKEKIFELGEKFVDRQMKKEKGQERESVRDALKNKKDEVSKQPRKEVVEKAVKTKTEEL